MTRLELLEMDGRYLTHMEAALPLAPARGEGAFLFDDEGRAYLDFSGAPCLKHGHEALAEALLDQALRGGQGPFWHEPILALAKTLCLRSGMSRACFTSSGSAGNEAMLALARRYSYARYGPGRATVLTLHAAAHGTSFHTLAASGLAPPGLLPGDQGFCQVAAELAALRTVPHPERVCAVMLEPIGVLPHSKQFIHELAVLCAERDWLLLLDEVRTGVGRTGALFAFLQYGILPDALSFGRSLAGGLPFGGMLVNSRCASVFDGDDPAALPLPSPVCAAAALTVLDTLNETALEDIARKGDYLKSGLETLHLACLGELRGLGLLRAAQVFGDAEDFARRLRRAGLLCLAKGDAIALLPPLLIERRELDEALRILEVTLKDVEPNEEMRTV